MSARDECIDFLYAEVRMQVPISKQAYVTSLDGWDVEPIMNGAQKLGVYIRKGHETHMLMSKQNSLLHARHIIRVYLTANLERLGYLTTKTDGNAVDHRFLTRLGYYETGKDGVMTVYRLDQLKIK